MKVIRRRAADPALQWAPVDVDHQYRVTIRNEDTGDRRIIYDGFRTECRLPPDLRLTPDQLTFRVESRPADDPEARFVRCQEFTVIPRLGDDLETPAPDLIVGEEAAGTREYRLLVEDSVTGARLVDMVSAKPRFLMPVGLLAGRDCQYHLLHRVRGTWRGQRGLPVTAAMISAAVERAEQTAALPEVSKPRMLGDPARYPPGRPDRLAQHAARPGARLVIAVEVTVQPTLSPVADPEAVIRAQWWSGGGEAALEQVVLMLEAHGLKGLFLLDVFADEALGHGAAARIARLLQGRGHGLALLINPKPWRALSPALAALKPKAVVPEAVRRFTEAVGAPPLTAAFGPEALGESALLACRDAGLGAVIVDRAEQKALPAWMRWRTAPFTPFDGLAVLPVGMILSTPAHDGDQVVRHGLKSSDALVASETTALAAEIGEGDDRLVLALVDPLSILQRRLLRSAAVADDWNAALADELKAWSAAGWDRSPHGFLVFDGFDSIKKDILSDLLVGLARSDVSCAAPGETLSPEALRAFCQSRPGAERLLEYRRGPRQMRSSRVRLYDEAFRQALRRDPA